MTVITTALDRAGLRIGEQRFADLVAAAARDLTPPGAADPEAELTASDAAALREVGADLAPRRRGESDARAGSTAAYVALLATALSVGEVATKLGIDASRVRHRLAAATLLGIKHGRGWLVPAWQFGIDGALLPGLSQLAPALRGLHPVVAASYAATPQPELRISGRARSPRDWLAGGGDPAVAVVLARAIAEQF